MWRSSSAACGLSRLSRKCANRFAKITMPEVEAIGCKASSIAPARRCGSPLATERETPFGNAGQKRPGDLRVLKPKASALKFHQSNGSRQDNALLALRKHSRVLRHSRASADCFRANPVASALGTAPGATPARLCEHTMRVSAEPSKPELSTWLETGTFYLAPTLVGANHSWPESRPGWQSRRCFARNSYGCATARRISLDCLLRQK